MKMGFAGSLAAAFINSKITPLIIVASIGLGVAAVLKTPREEEPQIIVPMADVMVSMPGASATEVERRVSTPMEKLIWEIPGVEYVYSTSSPGQSLVTVRFLVGENEEASFVRLRDKLQSNYDIIPPGASKPIIKPRSINDVAILAITLHSRFYDSTELRLLADRVEDSIKRVDNVSVTQIIGGQPMQMTIAPSPTRLAAFGLTPDAINQAILTGNTQAIAGSFSSNDTNSVVKSGGFLKTPADAKSLIVANRNGQPVYLSDVASVSLAGAEPTSYVYFGYGPSALHAEQTAEGVGAGRQVNAPLPPESIGTLEPAVTISVAKRAGTNAVDIANAVLKKVNSLKGTLVPDNVEMTVTRNYGQTASEKSNELLLHMGLAVISVTILIALTLGWRESGVVAIAIPVTLALTLLIFYLYSYTLNRITLFALIFCIGILVDDAIVVVENIVRHYRMPVEERQPILQATLHAVDEVGNPTILATATVIAAILPLAFVRGLMGPYMRPIPVGASSAMVFSLLIAFIVTPWAALRLLRKEHGHAHPGHQDPSHNKSEGGVQAKSSPGFDENGMPIHSGRRAKEDLMTRWYRAIMNPLLDHPLARWSFLSVVVLLLIGACALVGYKLVIVKMLPFDNKNEFQIIVDMPTGTPLEQTAAATEALGRFVATVPEVDNYELYVGTASPYNFNGLVRQYYFRNQPYQADIQVNLVGKSHRKAQSHDIVKRIRPGIARIAQKWGIRVKVAEVPPGPPVLETLVAEIYGPTFERRKQVAAQIKHIFLTTPGVTDVDWYVNDPQPTYQFKVDRQKAALSGVDVAAINRTLQTALGGFQVGLFHDDQSREDIPITVRLPIADRSGVGALAGIYVPSTNGTAIPMQELVHPVLVPSDGSIYHKNLLPVVYVTGDVTGREESPIYAMLKMDKAIDQLKLPEGYKLNVLFTHMPTSTDRLQMKWDGEWQVTFEVFRDMGIAFAAVLILIYIIIVAWFQSFTVPLVIMVPIPLTLIGILPAHALLGAFFTATSMIGFIAGAGIIVRNSIILVDFTELRIEQGMPLKEAVIDAGIVRFRPMALTAAAVIVAASVILFDPIFQGLAISLMAGAIVSTLLSRIAVPLLYYMDRHRTDSHHPDLMGNSPNSPAGNSN